MPVTAARCCCSSNINCMVPWDWSSSSIGWAEARPGVAAIFRQLLGEGGPEICKLRPKSPPKPGTQLSFGKLLSALYRRDRLILIAVEIEDEQGGRTLISCPEPGTDESSFDSGQLVGVVALGDPDRLAPSDERCGHCFSRR